MTMNRHEPFEELISASLHGDLSPDERRRLDAHLDGCAACRDTLAAFAEQRRIVAGMRHLAPPRDLGARVRAGVEGSSGVSWWRRPIAIFTTVGGGLAVVAGALLALVMLNGTDDPNLGLVSPTPSVSLAPATPTPTPTPTQQPTLPPVTDPEASPTPVPPDVTPAPSASPAENPLADASPEPDLYIAIAPSDDQTLTLREGSNDVLVTEPEEPPGPPAQPIAAELTSDGQWLAYIGDLGLSGMTEVRATRVAEGRSSDDPDATPTPGSTATVGDTLVLGTSMAGSPFLERLAWSGDGRYLAFTLADTAGGGTDVWIFEPETEEFWQLTDVGDAYAGSWASAGGDDPGGDAVDALWVSRAEGEVASYLTPVTDAGGTRRESIDPAEESLAMAERVFQPILSPNGGLAIYWDGIMTRSGDEWLFAEGGAPFLAEHKPDDAGALGFENERPLFSDIVVDRDAFTSAAISWGLDGNSYAVWDAAWTGLPQTDEGDYPDRARVYFGHATDPRGLTRDHALDAADLPSEGRVVDVKVSPTGEHLVITFAYPVAGDTVAPRADLILVKRNTGSVADEVRPLREGGWNGPAAFDASSEVEAP